MAIGGLGAPRPQMTPPTQKPRVSQQKPQVKASDSSQSTSQSQKAKTQQKALATKANSQKMKAESASVKNKQAKQQKIKQQTNAVSSDKIQGNSSKLDGSLSSTTSSDSQTGKTIKTLSQSEIAKKVSQGQQRRGLDKLAKKQEGVRENIDKPGDLLEDPGEAIGDFLEAFKSESGGVIEKAMVEKGLVNTASLESVEEGVNQVGNVLTGIKAVVSLKHMIQNPQDKHAKVDLLTSGLDLTGEFTDDENIKAVSTIVKAAQEIYKKQQEGKMDTETAVDQLSKVGEQLGKALEQTIKGESVSASMIVSGASFISEYLPDVSTYMPDAVSGSLSYMSSAASGVSGYMPDMSSMTSMMPATETLSGVSEWVPGLATLPAAYQLYNDVQSYRKGEDGSGTKVALSTVKLAGSYWGGVGKAVGVGADLMRWGMGLSGGDD